MGRKTKVNFEGKDYDAEYIEINQNNEYWNQYLLEDGTVLKLKPIATEVVRLADAYDGEGNPVYVIKSKNIVTVTSPEQMRKKS